jgi:hypothetical protein
VNRDARAKVASIGVTRTKLAVEEELGWLFRDQPTEDYGIDAQVEVVDEETVKGRLLALQIKSGKNWFKEPARDGWWFRPDVKHVQYWTNHSLPVVIVLYRPKTKRCHWQLINTASLERSKTDGWKVRVPESHVLTRQFAPNLRAAADGDPYLLRIRELRLARPWMQLLASGNRLVVDIEEWVNKLTGRGAISLGIDREDGNPPEKLAEWTVLARGPRYETQLPALFPWAEVGLHEETYDDADWDHYEIDCVRIDKEGDRIITESYEDWRDGRLSRGLRPYAIKSDEVALWRLELSLNDLGMAFLRVDDYGLGEGNSLIPLQEP